LHKISKLVGDSED